MPLLRDLEYPNIYVTIHLRPGFRPIRFHWTLFVPHPPIVDPVSGEQRITTGVKYHAKEIACEPFWAYEVDWNFNLADCLSIGVAVVIGRLSSPWTTSMIDELLSTQVPLTFIPELDLHRERRYTCRVWLREAIRVLNFHGAIQCSDVDELEYEIRAYGERVVVYAEHGLFRGAEIYYSQFSR
ncbi:hypothetical protein O181_021368 [Austropuccinia psidii MF-1]|uniref:Uncharacterized protein n=1 Tax=Austropuccinia psidii MF-1 TaxID=1389203 RepID=A0A9Q3CD91_9BASI|nr:hypothetical protein [Austropuccinia psidii MF-1]